MVEPVISKKGIDHSLFSMLRNRIKGMQWLPFCVNVVVVVVVVCCCCCCCFCLLFVVVIIIVAAAAASVSLTCRRDAVDSLHALDPVDQPALAHPRPSAQPGQWLLLGDASQ
jgi:hypothetical protein